MEICNPESITITAIPDEDLKLEGEFGSVVRIARGEATEVKMKSTTKFERLMDYFYTRHCLAKGSLAFFFVEKLSPDQCPADVHMKMGDTIHIKNCLKGPKNLPMEPKSHYKEQIRFRSICYYSSRSGHINMRIRIGRHHSIPSINQSSVHLAMGLEKMLTSSNRKLLEEKILSDVTFIVEDQRICAHKALLVARCERFKAMFTGSMKESYEKEIEISSHSAICFNIMLEYIYTDTLSEGLNLDTYLELLQLSDEYLLTSFTRMCESRIAKLVTVHNVSIILTAADKFNAKKLKKYCLGFILSNYSATVNTQEFKEHLKSPELLMEIMTAVAPYLPTRETAPVVIPSTSTQQTTNNTSFDLTM
eukprot:TRINITY_DN4825_c0_g1_i1.p1 TRINITY_DN4825_c0_g1~~TRINITY_DN4825_c0_g1_i1.p1  ORF type:complete len:363 (-),score=38.52 TRINITY_DN4825_c0_g1_i1:6-1094(-)